MNAGTGVTVLAAPAPAVAALFGDGTHPTSRLAAAALREVLAPRWGARVLDVGTGAGVLARAALTAGAGEVIGIDREPAAVDGARALCPWASFHVGDAAEYLPAVAGAFDVVVANLPDPPLMALVPALVAATRPRGALVVTGVLLWQAEALGKALTAAGAQPSAPRAEGGWAAYLALV